MNTDLRFEDGTRLRLQEPTSHPVVALLPGVGCHRLVLRIEVDSMAWPSPSCTGWPKNSRPTDVWRPPSSQGQRPPVFLRAAAA